MASFTTRNSGVAPTLRNFLSACAPLAQRDQAVFLKAVEATCTLQSRDGRKLISLIDKREENADKNVSDTRLRVGTCIVASMTRPLTMR